MKLDIKYNDIDWWFWAACLVGIAIGLLGFHWGISLLLAVSVLNLAYVLAFDGDPTSLDAQVREVWLALVLIAAYVPGMAWLFYLLGLGMIMVVFFDRCTIELILTKMPWNRDVAHR